MKSNNHLWHLIVGVALGLTFWVIMAALVHLLNTAQKAGV